MFVSRVLVFLQFALVSSLFLPLAITYESFYLFSLCMTLAAILLLWTTYHNRLGNFNIIPEIKEGCHLITTGPYRFIRHPMYTGVLLVGLGTLCLFALWKLPLFILLVGVMYLKAKREEKFWCEKDASYEAFKKRTKMFVPFLF